MPAERDALAVVVEVQLGRDPDKVWSWPVYVATVRSRVRCPTMLLVICTDTATAARCAEPIELGHPGLELAPLVVGPGNVPAVTDPGHAQQAPWLAVISALAHGGSPDGSRVLEALHAGLQSVDDEWARLYADVVNAALPEAARRYLEELMATQTYEYQSSFARKYYAQGRDEGRVEGEAKTVLAMLEARGIAVTDEVRAHLAGRLEVDDVDVWVRRAMTATSADDLLTA